MLVSIIIPCFNERGTIQEVVKKIHEVVLPSGMEKEIILIDDGSTDGVREIFSSPDFSNVKILSHERNFGKGRALRTGFSNASGEILIIQDADLEVSPSEYPALLQPILSGETGIVYGSRYLNSKSVPLGLRLLNMWTNVLYGSKLTDEATCHKVFKKSLLDTISLKCTGFEFCPEITAKFLKKGYKIAEVPISYLPRSKAEGKKLRYFIEGVKAAGTLLKYRFIS